MPRISGKADWILAALTLLVLAWIGTLSAWRASIVSRLTETALPALTPASDSITGYQAGRRALIVPERHSPTQEWVMQAQNQTASGTFRPRTSQFDNAPVGRAVDDPIPYRALLQSAGSLGGIFAGTSTPIGIENAAKWLDPILWGMWALCAALLGRRFFGTMGAIAAVIAVGLLPPFANVFYAGRLESHGLSLLLGSLSVWPLLSRQGRGRVSWAIAAVMAALGLWVNAPVQSVFCLGGVAGSLFLSAVGRRGSGAQPAAGPWLTWAAIGAACTAFFWALEQAPDRMGGWNLNRIHYFHTLGFLLLALIAWAADRASKKAIAWAAAVLLLGGAVTWLVMLPSALLLAAGLGAAAVAVMAGMLSGVWRYVIPGLVVGISLPSIFLAGKAAMRDPSTTLAVHEAEALMDRDLAFWLSQRMGSQTATVLAPALMSDSLAFHGGHRVIGTTHLANTEGFTAAVRLCSASSPDEASSLFQTREVTHIILPSWDQGLMDYARLGTKEPEKGFLGLLGQWLPPRWLRPVAYNAPQIPGLEDHWVVVYEVVETQDQAAALAHLGMYFMDTGREREAIAVSATLAANYPGEMIALIARARAEKLRGANSQYAEVIEELVAQVEAGNDEYLEWNDRLWLALILFDARKSDLGRQRLERCVSEASEPALRRATPFALYHLIRASRALRIEWPSTALRDAASGLLPPEFREKL